MSEAPTATDLAPAPVPAAIPAASAEVAAPVEPTTTEEPAAKAKENVSFIQRFKNILGLDKDKKK